jgi:hypothetical protein
MPVLTQEQEEQLERRMRRIYPPEVLAKLNGDNSVRSWWASRADELHRKMRAIDNDQARSLAMSLTKPVGISSVVA